MLLTRVLTVAVLLPLFLAGLFFLPGQWLSIALLPLALVGGWEWAVLAGFSSSARWAFCAAVLASMAALFFAAGLPQLNMVDQTIFLVSAIFWFAVAPVWLRCGWRPRSSILLAATGWILLVPNWLALVRLQEWPLVLLAVLGIVWSADIAPYFAGPSGWVRRLY